MTTSTRPTAILAATFAVLSPAQAAVPTSSADGLEAARAIIADVHKIVTPNGVDDTFELVLGDARQMVNVRGADRANPILIYVHGGPGSVEMPMAWTFQRP